MDQTRTQDIVRHIMKDDDKGISMMEKLSLDDAVSVMTQVIPALKNQAKERNSSNDYQYFSTAENIYRKVLVDKIKQEEHLWVVYSDTTSYPYMLDDDLILVYNPSNTSKISEKLEKSGYAVSMGGEDGSTLMHEISHMYRNGYKNVRVTDGDKKMYSIPREDFAAYDEFFDDEYITNPGFQNAMISYFQEFRKKSTEGIGDILSTRESLMLASMKNAEFMVPCVKEETDDEISIAHHFIDVTERVEHKEGEQVIAIPAFTDGFEMDKCYEGHYENMLYTFSELVNSVDELSASGVIFNALGISYFMPIDTLKKIAKG